MQVFKSFTYAQLGLPSISPAHLPFWLTFKREDIALDVRYLGVKRIPLISQLDSTSICLQYVLGVRERLRAGIALEAWPVPVCTLQTRDTGKTHTHLCRKDGLGGSEAELLCTVGEFGSTKVWASMVFFVMPSAQPRCHLFKRRMRSSG